MAKCVSSKRAGRREVAKSAAATASELQSAERARVRALGPPSVYRRHGDPLPAPDARMQSQLATGAGFFAGVSPVDVLLLPWTLMNQRLNWDSDGADWPQREASRFVVADGLRWHVQVAGQGPVLLLVHGTGASTHSWRGLMPLLARHFTVVAPDLPGHAFTDPLPARRLSLPGVAQALASLLSALSLSPRFVLGHSAGAAVLLRMTLDARIAPRMVLSLNGALLPFAGWAGLFFAPMARLMTMTTLPALLFARRARDIGAVTRLVASTGSTLDARGLALYQRLLSSPGHVAGALDMMASWDLEPLARDLSRLATPLHLLVAERDATVDPGEAQRVTRAVAGATVTMMSGLGHLAHEEAPERVLQLVLAALREDHRSGVLVREAGQQ